jgi:hypothetical protein
MRSVMRGFCSVFLAAALSGMMVSSTSASWYWPWGSDQTPKQATPVTSAPPLRQATPATSASSSSTSVLHPSTWKAPWSTGTTASTAKTTPPAKNAWTKPQSANTAPSPWQSMKNGTHRVENATASAWHKTVNAVTPGSDQPKQQVAQQQPQKSWWSRMWGSSEEEKPDGPRTVGEFMAQKRLEP